MNRSSRRSNKSRVPAIAVLFGAFVLLVGWSLPWVSGPALAHTYGALDLAEWVSLVPGIRYGEQPMLIPGLLRAPLMLLALALSLLPNRRFERTWWLSLLAVIVLAVGLLPPLEFFIRPDWRGDVNYGQMATFSLITLIGGGIGLVGLPIRIRLGAWSALGAGLLISGSVGNLLAVETLTRYALNQQSALGLGIFGLGVAVCFVGGWAFITAGERKNGGRG